MRRAAKVAGAAAALILPASSYVAYKYRLHHSSYYARHPNGFVDEPPPVPENAVEKALYTLSRYITVYTIGQLSSIFHNLANKPEVLDRHKLDRFIAFSRNGQPLVTVSNHESMVDDPSGMSTMVPHSVRMSPYRMRWGACSEYQCYRRGEAFATMVTAGNTLPMQVGASMYQWGMAGLADKLDEGEWVHLFPEGRIWQEFGKTRRREDGRWCLPSGRCSAPWLKLGPFKWGVGKLIANSAVVPIVVPYFTMGLSTFMPQRSKDDDLREDAPRFGSDITFKVGDPVEVADLIKAYHHAAIQRAVQRQGEREAAAARGEPLVPATYTPTQRVGEDGVTPLAISKDTWRYFTADRWLDDAGSVAFPNRVTPDGRAVPGHIEPPLRVRPPDHHLLTEEQAREEEGHRLQLYADITQRLWEAMAQLEAEVREYRRGKGLGDLDDKQG